MGVHSAQQVGNLNNVQELHPPGWLRSSKVPHCDMQPAVSSSHLALHLAHKLAAPTLASGQPEGSPAYSSYKHKA